ncbi:alpha/beta hydrolase (plasmid) [Thioclava litoralis]|uniref:Alpha/beta hydrolase n=1 Tax=Thioclava litoralis TaxID=3076557 RepID=A0ABZ1E392_9RHOB|nr:alpha/beta hydrolase [Thioclava sp. FTW29]
MPSASGSPFYAHVRQHEAAFAGLPDYAHEALFRAYIQNAAHYPLREESIRLYFEPWSDAVGKAAFYRQIGQADTANIAEAQERYGKTDFDVHLIWGEEDTFIPLAQGEELAGLVHAKSFTRVPSAAHIGQEDAPEALLGALLANI